MGKLVEQTKVTYAEYRQFEADDRYWYELLNGRLVKKSSPSPRHQRIVTVLLTSLHTYTSRKNLGEVFTAPLDVFLNEHNAPQPDLIFVSNKNKEIITDDGIMGPPEAVVEIISPSSLVRDRVEKKELYEQSGIKEYWIIDQANQAVEIYVLGKNKRYLLHDSGTQGDGTVHSKIIKDFSIELKELFG